MLTRLIKEIYAYGFCFLDSVQPWFKFKRMYLKLMMKVQDEDSNITLIYFPYAL